MKIIIFITIFINVVSEERINTNKIFPPGVKYNIYQFLNIAEDAVLTTVSLKYLPLVNINDSEKLQCKSIKI